MFDIWRNVEGVSRKFCLMFSKSISAGMVPRRNLRFGKILVCTKGMSFFLSELFLSHSAEKLRGVLKIWASTVKRIIKRRMGLPRRLDRFEVGGSVFRGKRGDIQKYLFVPMSGNSRRDYLSLLLKVNIALRFQICICETFLGYLLEMKQILGCSNIHLQRNIRIVDGFWLRHLFFVLKVLVPHPLCFQCQSEFKLSAI